MPLALEGIEVRLMEAGQMIDLLRRKVADDFELVAA